MSRLLAFATILALFFVCIAPQDAVAKSRKKKAPKADPKNALIIKALGSLKWGETKDKVVRKLLEEGMNEARNDPALKRDRVRMQQAMKLVRDKSKKFADTYTKLTGATNLDVSVIGDEFITDHNESYLRVVDSRSQRYFFFYRNRLYKYVVAYNKSYLQDVNFEGFVRAAIEKYGRPTEAYYDDVDDEDVLTSVEWKTDQVTLVIKNKQRFFGTYTMTFAEPRVYEQWMTMKKAADERKERKDTVSSEVRSLIQTGEVRTNNSAVTSIVGTTNVDIKSVIPKDNSEAERAKAEAEKKKKEAEEKKRKKKNKKKRKARRKGKLDLSGADATTGKGLIIY